MNRLDATFARLREAGEIGILPYLTTGFPDPASCADLLDALAAAGADGIEIGVPFSDPLADGTSLQRVGARALEQGASIEMAFNLLRGVRRRWELPVVFMSYYNPVLAYGVQQLAWDGGAAGLDGLIVPDLPLEEAGPVGEALRASGLHLIYMLAPTSTPARLARTARTASGFIYCVTLVGVTGARTVLSDELPEFLDRVRQGCHQPLVAGFGISRPEHIRAIRDRVDGVIVASALANLIEGARPEERIAAVSRYIKDLKVASRREKAAPTA